MQGLPPALSLPVPIDTPGWREALRVKCLVQENNTMPPAGARTRIARSVAGDERTNHDTPAPPNYFIEQIINLDPFLIMWLFKRLCLTLFHFFFFFSVVIYYLCFSSVLVFFLWRFYFYLSLKTEKFLFSLVVLSVFLLMGCLVEQVWRWSSLRLNCRFRIWKDAL